MISVYFFSRKLQITSKWFVSEFFLSKKGEIWNVCEIYLMN